uniref:Uncharacterized protein n=1 Tax=Rhipicephalus appendiculatus TaxID=34631 RepID=A0A131YAR8_RHIAP
MQVSTIDQFVLCILFQLLNGVCTLSSFVKGNTRAHVVRSAAVEPLYMLPFLKVAYTATLPTYCQICHLVSPNTPEWLLRPLYEA